MDDECSVYLLEKMIIEDTADLFMVDEKYPLAFTVVVNVISMPK